MITIKVVCVSCGITKYIEVTQEQHDELHNPNRRKIQEILPKHTPAEREMFVSRICEDCWNKMFSEEVDNG